MKQTFILWLGAAVMVFLFGYLNSVMSRDYPVTGTVGINAQKVSYRFDRKFNTRDNYRVLLRSDVDDLDAMVQWRKINDKSWNEIKMKQSGDMFLSYLPKFSVNERIEYRIKVNREEKSRVLPGGKPVTMEFTGKVPATIMVLYYLTLFGGLLLSTRTGLEYFKEKDKVKRFSFLTLGCFFLYTFVNPIKATFELDVVNKRIPFITELFDIQTILFLLLWIAGMWGAFKAKKPKLFVLVISILTILAFLLVRF